jgi:hypothetical protein
MQINSTAAKNGGGDFSLGVDTHLDAHAAVALDGLGRCLGTRHCCVGRRGWWVPWGPPAWRGRATTVLASPASFARGAFRVLEVSRPKRRDQRGLGKSDAIDAELVARAVLAGTAAPARRRARTASWSLSGPSGRRTARRSRPTTRPQTSLSRGVELVRWTP